jgi:hypothetical protein
MEREKIYNLYRLLYPNDNSKEMLDPEYSDVVDHYRLARKIDEALDEICANPNTTNWKILIIITRALYIRVNPEDSVIRTCNKFRKIYQSYYRKILPDEFNEFEFNNIEIN